MAQIVLIVGSNRAEFCKPKPKDVDNKHFFVTRNQLYKVYPDMYTRVRHYYCEVPVSTDEMIIYPENGIRPDIQRGAVTDFDKLMADIDEHKMLNGSSKRKNVGTLSSKVSSFKKFFPMLLVGIVLAYAFITNGGL